MTDLNQRILDQNNQIKNITRVANEANVVQITTLEALNRQGDQIDRNIGMVNETKDQLKYTEKITDQMRRRNLCIKISLWISVIVLFAALVGSIVFKFAK